jgi:DNA repair protein RecN (Recombination protein N)
VLTQLHIRNLAVLDEIEISLAPGFSALTGETGAGKSMLVDALALALGERADSGAVRADAQRAEVTAVFTVGRESPVNAWLAERDLQSSQECHLRRVVTPEGRSRGYINGQQVPMEMLRELGEHLIEICGQHAHQTLARSATQREILDAHGGHGPLLTAVADAHRKWVALEAECRALQSGQRDRQDRQDLLSYQVRELQALNLQAGEFEALDQERLLLANVGRISAGLSQALERLIDADEASANDAIGIALREIQALSALDAELGGAATALEQSRIELRDATDQIRRRLLDMEHDPVRQDEVESRLTSAVDLARKHRVEPNRLWALTHALEAELASITASDSRLETFAEESARHRGALGKAVELLRRGRQQAARPLAEAVTKNLRRLGMADSVFEVRVEPLPLEQIGLAGGDLVEFLISTNPGQNPGSIGRIASGGELSRLSLAIQVVAMTDHGAPTLIFDEVDAGIGGGVAEIVGQCLKRLSAQRQVLCVTHLAQVASLADHHFAVTKTTAGKATRTTVQELAGNDRVDEVARMLGGVTITERTRDHAKEMLRSARPRRAG